MGIQSSDIAGELDEEQQGQIIEGLLKSLADRDEVPYILPSEENLPEVSRRPRVETGG